MKEQRLAHFSSIFFSLILFALAIVALRQQLVKYNVGEIWESVRSISSWKILLGMTLTMVNYLMLTGYDTLAVHYIKHPLPYRKTALVASISYAISNSVGLALLSGSAIRFRFYKKWGFSVTEIAQIIAFCNLSFWLGLLAVGGVLFTLEPLEIPAFLDLPFKSVHPLGEIFLTIVISYLLISVFKKDPLKFGQWTIPHLSFQTCLAQIIITSLDWGLVCAILYLLLPIQAHLSFAGFFGIYLLGQIAGIISNIPGGLGVFESILIFLLSPYISPDQIFVSLLAYRGIYYFFPLLTSLFFLGLYELKQLIINN